MAPTRTAGYYKIGPFAILQRFSSSFSNTIASYPSSFLSIATRRNHYYICSGFAVQAPPRPRPRPRPPALISLSLSPVNRYIHTSSYSRNSEKQQILPLESPSPRSHDPVKDAKALDIMTKDVQSSEAGVATAYKFATRAVHAGSPHDPVTGAVIEPISLSTTFAQNAVGKPVGAYEYSRSDNPNRSNFEKAIASLEGAKYALAYSSGSATTANVLASLAPGSHVISVSDVYGGTHRYFTQVAAAQGIAVTFTGSIAIDIHTLVRPETKLVWIETPSNPTLSLVDIEEVSKAAHSYGLKVVVDNTFLSPYVQNPLKHGADVVVHSVTKYINGHSDVVMGVAALNDDALYQRLLFLQNAIGAIPSPFDSWLAHRGVKTLHLRARAATENATAVANALEASHHVIAVNYPGLASHPHRKVAVKQHRNGMGGGMISFRIKGGEAAAKLFCEKTKIFTLAESLGGVESLVEVPGSMTHAGIPKAEREAAGVFDDLVRLSCGVEDSEDLVSDVLSALDAVAADIKTGEVSA